MSTRISMAAALVLMLAGAAYAQFVGGAAAAIAPWVGGNYWWGGGGYGYGAGTTPAGSYMEGMSQVIRAQGEYERQASEAMINFEEARSKYLDNRKKWTQTYFAMKEENQAKQAEKRERNRVSPQAVASSAKSAAPRTLGPDALDPLTGKITWPEALLDDQYDPLRNEIDKLIELRAKTTRAGNLDKIHDATRKLAGQLKENIMKMTPNEYIQARKFLDSLDYTASRGMG